MTPQEAIEKLKGMQNADAEDIIGRLENKYIGSKKYESVYDLSINALEKQIPKKPKEIGGWEKCIVCGNNITIYDIEGEKVHCDYCPYCGQRLRKTK